MKKRPTKPRNPLTGAALRVDESDPNAKPVTRMPKPPAGIGREASRIWRQLARDLIDARRMLRCDLPLLKAAAESSARADRLAKMARDATPMATGSRGQPVINPIFAAADAAARTAAGLLKDLACAPAPRARLKPMADQLRPEGAAADEEKMAASLIDGPRTSARTDPSPN